MIRLAPPPLVFRGKRWSTEELTGMALAWRDALGPEFCASSTPTALVMSNHPSAVALFFALSSLPAPLIVFPPDLLGWRSSPPMPAGTRLVLPRGIEARGASAEQAGLRVISLPEPAAPVSARDDHGFMTAPAVVLFTSGSTDLPRPVCRPLAALVAAASGLGAGLDSPGRRRDRRLAPRPQPRHDPLPSARHRPTLPARASRPLRSQRGAVALRVRRVSLLARHAGHG